MRHLFLNNHLIKHSPIGAKIQWTLVNCTIDFVRTMTNAPDFEFGSLQLVTHKNCMSVVDALKIP